MDKLNQWLALFANLDVPVGIFFLDYEVRQNTVSVCIARTLLRRLMS